jgi:WD40 repeat protein
MWDVATGRQLPRLEGDKCRPVSIKFSPDGRILASGGFEKIILWDATSGNRLTTLDGFATILFVAFSPDGSTLASGGSDDMVRLWDVQSRTQRHALSGHSLGVLAVAFSPDGRTIASGSMDNTVKLWHASTGDELATLESPAAMTWLAFSPDGKTLAGGAVGKRVILWHADVERRTWPLGLR